MTKEWKLCDW